MGVMLLLVVWDKHSYLVALRLLVAVLHPAQVTLEEVLDGPVRVSICPQDQYQDCLLNHPLLVVEQAQDKAAVFHNLLLPLSACHLDKDRYRQS